MWNPIRIVEVTRVACISTQSHTNFHRNAYFIHLAEVPGCPNKVVGILEVRFFVCPRNCILHLNSLHNQKSSAIFSDNILGALCYPLRDMQGAEFVKACRCPNRAAQNLQVRFLALPRNCTLHSNSLHKHNQTSSGEYDLIPGGPSTDRNGLSCRYTAWCPMRALAAYVRSNVVSRATSCWDTVSLLSESASWYFRSCFSSRSVIRVCR